MVQRLGLVFIFFPLMIHCKLKLIEIRMEALRERVLEEFIPIRPTPESGLKKRISKKGISFAC